MKYTRSLLESRGVLDTTRVQCKVSHFFLNFEVDEKTAQDNLVERQRNEMQGAELAVSLADANLVRVVLLSNARGCPDGWGCFGGTRT